MAVTVREANRALKRLPAYAKEASQKTMNVTAYQVARGAQARAPYKTGALRRGIRWEARPRSVRAVVGVDPSAFHWRYQEYGTVKMGARPFLRPAAEAEESDHMRRLTQALERAGVQMVQSAGSRLL